MTETRWRSLTILSLPLIGLKIKLLSACAVTIPFGITILLTTWATMLRIKRCHTTYFSSGEVAETESEDGE